MDLCRLACDIIYVGQHCHMVFYDRIRVHYVVVICLSDTCTFGIVVVDCLITLGIIVFDSLSDMLGIMVVDCLSDMLGFMVVDCLSDMMGIVVFDCMSNMLGIVVVVCLSDTCILGIVLVDCLICWAS